MNFSEIELENEKWKSMTGYDYQYQISDLGRFRRVTAFHKNKIGEITLGSFDNHGYLRIGLVKGGKQIGKKIHRLVAEYFIKEYTEDLTINHKNFIKNDNRLCNIELMTVVENIFHYIKKIKKETSSSNYIGVNFHINLKKWATRVLVDGKRCSVGTYDTEQKAIQAIKDFNNGIRRLSLGKGAREKLTKNEIKELVSLLGKETKRSLAKKYNISYTTVFNIIEKYERTN